MVKSKLYQKDYARELLAVAKEDFETAVILKQNNIKRKENIYFHIQQSVEKSIKAYLCWIEQPVPLVHDLIVIFDRLPKDCQMPFKEELADLSQFAASRRYYMGYEKDSEEIDEILTASKEIIDWVEQQILIGPDCL